MEDRKIIRKMDRAIDIGAILKVAAAPLLVLSIVNSAEAVSRENPQFTNWPRKQTTIDSLLSKCFAALVSGSILLKGTLKYKIVSQGDQVPGKIVELSNEQAEDIKNFLENDLLSSLARPTNFSLTLTNRIGEFVEVFDVVNRYHSRGEFDFDQLIDWAKSIYRFLYFDQLYPKDKSFTMLGRIEMFSQTLDLVEGAELVDRLDSNSIPLSQKAHFELVLVTVKRIYSSPDNPYNP